MKKHKHQFGKGGYCIDSGCLVVDDRELPLSSKIDVIGNPLQYDLGEKMNCKKCGNEFFRWRYYRCPNCGEGH